MLKSLDGPQKASMLSHMAHETDHMPILGPLADATRFKRPVGRPRNKPKIRNLMAALPSVEERIANDPDSYVPAVHDKMLTLQCRINLERALRADPADKDAAFYLKKAAVTVQVLQLLEGTKSVVWTKTDDKKFPSTNADLDREIASRSANIKRLATFVAKNHIPTPPPEMAPIEATDAQKDS